MIYDWTCTCGYTCFTVMSVTKIIGHKQRCDDCGGTMRRDYAREGVALAESSRNKGVFPYTDQNLGHEPVQVESQQHRRRLMKERGLVDNDLTSDMRHRLKDSARKPTVSVPGRKES